MKKAMASASGVLRIIKKIGGAMKFSIFLLIAYLIAPEFCQAQSVSIRIIGSKSEIALLYSLQGETTAKLDSVKPATGIGYSDYVINMKQQHPGFYRLALPGNKWVDFVLGEENILIETDIANIQENLKVINSESNRLYYSFVKLNKQFKIKTELLQLLLSHYPKEDAFYADAENRFKKLRHEYLNFVNIQAQKQPESFIARYIKSSQLPVVDSNLPPEEQLIYLKMHALDKINFKDSPLIYSDLFTSKTIEYLTYFRNPQLTKELLEKEFAKAVDTLLNKAKINPLVYQQMTEYLIEGFRKFGFDKIIDYIVDNYVIKDDLCLDSKVEHSIQRRIDQSRLLPINSLVPDFNLPDTAGKIINLSEIRAGKMLLLFYGSFCPHCQELMPGLNELYKDQKGQNFEIVAISMDSNKKDWIDFIKKNHMDWINISDLNGWESQVVSEFHIYATPTMFLIDRDRKIIGKPLSAADLRKILKND